jgi:hypothetical protein
MRYACGGIARSGAAEEAIAGTITDRSALGQPAYIASYLIKACVPERFECSVKRLGGAAFR